MAKYYDIDTDVRINGSLSLPSGSLTVGGIITVGNITLNNTSGQITATKLSGDGSLLTNLSSANMTGVLLQDGTRAMTGNLGLAGHEIRIGNDSADSTHSIKYQLYENDGTTLVDGPRITGYSGVEIYGAQAGAQLAVFRKTGSKINSPLSIGGDFSAASYTVTAATINATSNLQENGTSLSSKYLGISAKATDSDKLGGNSPTYFARAASAPNSVISYDNRNVNEAPQDRDFGLYVDFKANATNSLSDAGQYNGVLTFRPYGSGGDMSGGITHQLGFTDNGNIWHRNSTSGTAWGNWYKMYHSGNLDITTFLTTGTSQTTGSGFTVKGTEYIGASGNSGRLGVTDTNNVKLIDLDAASTNSPLGGASTNVYIQGNGNATFKGTVGVNKLTVTDATVVANLNASKLNGLVDIDFVKNASILDQGGYGIIAGFGTVATSPPSGQVTVSAGTAYLNNGRRVSTSDISIGFSSASTTYDRIDVIYIKDSSNYSDSAPLGVATGTPSATPSVPSIPSGAIPVAQILIKQNAQGGVTVTDGTGGSADQVTDARQYRPYLYDGTTFTMNGKNLNATTIYENGTLLTNKYAQLAAANTFTGNQNINGRVVITSSGTVSDINSTSYYINITDGTKKMLFAPDAIVAANDIWVTTSTNKTIYLNGSTSVNSSGYVKASKNATTITIPAGQTSATWTHNYGATSYAIHLTANSFDRHVRWNNKQANTISVEIDTAASQDILVDCILIGY